jgi:hypothetical protein
MRNSIVVHCSWSDRTRAASGEGEGSIGGSSRERATPWDERRTAPTKTKNRNRKCDLIGVGFRIILVVSIICGITEGTGEHSRFTIDSVAEDAAWRKS